MNSGANLLSLKEMCFLVLCGGSSISFTPQYFRDTYPAKGKGAATGYYTWINEDLNRWKALLPHDLFKQLIQFKETLRGHAHHDVATLIDTTVFVKTEIVRRVFVNGNMRILERHFKKRKMNGQAIECNDDDCGDIGICNNCKAIEKVHRGELNHFKIKFYP